MSRWKSLRAFVFAGALFTLAACGQTQAPPQANSNAPQVADREKNVDLTNPDIGLDADLAAAIRVERESDFNVTSPAVDNEAAGLSNQEKDFASRTSQLGTVTSTGSVTVNGTSGRIYYERRSGALSSVKPTPSSSMAGRSGATNGKLLREGGGAIAHFQANLHIEQPGNAGGGVPLHLDPMAPGESSTENYQPIFDNPYKLVKLDPMSTISSAVDTASYSNIRARLNAGQLPPKDAVRIADMLNYFNYDYAGPKNADPVAFSLEIAACPWQPKHHLLRIGLKAKTIDKEKMPPRNLTFLIDTSGSMGAANRLPLLKEAFKLLVQELTEKDTVSIVTYAGQALPTMPPTPGNEKDTIIQVIDSLNADGSTNGGGGIVAAYDQAKTSFNKDGVNRVILATDGDFNVGVSSDAELVRLIEEKRETGVYLTVLGFGMGNLKDSKLEQLAHHGNGHYAYIDTLDEAKKVFVEQGGSLVTVAKDVKLQIEFNPAKVAGYRLIGYENRVLRNEDFRDDKKDAGDMGSGHTCTALYEIVPAGEKVANGEVEPLKYQTTPKLSDAAKSGEWATVRMRYKDPATDKASEVEAPLKGEALGKPASNDFEFAANVAAFGMLLRESEFKGNMTYQAVLETAEGLLRTKKDAHREEFVKLARVALTIEQAKQKK